MNQDESTSENGKGAEENGRMVSIGISIFVVRGQPVRYKAPLLDSPPRGLKHDRGLVSGQYRSLWQENRSELETATRRNRHHAYLTGPYLLVAWFRCTYRLPLPRSQRARSSEKGAPLRFQGKSRLGFYPLPLSEAQRIRRFLCFPDAPSSAIDPCIGDGVAFEVITTGAEVIRYGIELDAYRAEQASRPTSPACNGVRGRPVADTGSAKRMRPACRYANDCGNRSSISSRGSPR